MKSVIEYSLVRISSRKKTRPSTGFIIKADTPYSLIFKVPELLHAILEVKSF